MDGYNTISVIMNLLPNHSSNVY